MCADSFDTYHLCAMADFRPGMISTGWGAGGQLKTALINSGRNSRLLAGPLDSCEHLTIVMKEGVERRFNMSWPLSCSLEGIVGVCVRFTIVTKQSVKWRFNTP